MNENPLILLSARPLVIHPILLHIISANFMNPQPEQNYQFTSLHLFEELFEPLIDQSRNIVIRYHIQEENPGKNLGWQIAIHSVNGCRTSDEFRIKMTALVDSSLHLVYDSLQQVHYSLRSPHIEYIRNKLQALNLIVIDEQSVFHDETGNFSRHHQFKTFTNCRLVGSKEGNCQMFGQYIRFKAAKFAEVWLDVISGAIDRLDLIHNLLSQSLPDDSTSHLQVVSQTNNFKLKFNLSVPEIGYLGKLLKRSGIIDIPSRHTPLFIKWITENIRSKNRDAIQSSSMRKNYFSSDLSSLDFWENILLKWLSIIRKERDRLSK